MYSQVDLIYLRSHYLNSHSDEFSEWLPERKRSVLAEIKLLYQCNEVGAWYGNSSQLPHVAIARLICATNTSRSPTMHGKKNKTIGERRRKAGNQREKLLDAVATRRMFHERANERATKQGRSTPCECRYTHGNDPERRPDHTSYTSYSEP